VAIVLAFRVAIYLAPAGGAAATRVVRWAEGPGVDTGNALWRRLNDPSESDADLTEAVGAASGRLSSVTTYSGSFTTRKLHLVFGRTSGAAIPEDDAIVTMHFLKLAAGAPSDDWVVGDFTGAESGLDTLWTALKAFARNNVTLKQYRWYAAGPDIDTALGGPGRTGPPRRVTDRSVAGTYSGVASANGSPPQVALTHTEQTTDKKAWGRAYWPLNGGSDAFLTTSGRLAPAAQTTIANALDTFYEAQLAAGAPLVVYSSAKPVRGQKVGPDLPAKAARALTVDQVQVDDILDVIRSRRWGSSLLRLQRAIG